MNTVETFVESYEFNRGRTLALLDSIEQLPNPAQVLLWRPGPERAHIGWQLMHIGITEEIFASERLLPERESAHTDLWHRFRGGSTPDDQLPSAGEVRQLLGDTRQRLLETLGELGDDRLDEIPPALAERNWTVRTVLHVLGWHESHHQGQAHLTLNLYKANQ